MKVTKLAQNKNVFLVNIYIDDQFFQTVDKNFMLEHGLFKGKELSQEDLEELFHKGEQNKFYNLVLNRISARPRSVKECRDYMRQKQLDPEVIEQVLNKLIENKYLADLDFAKWWVDSRMTFRAKSRRELQAELSQKGIAKETIDQVLSEGLNAEDEESNLQQLIAKKWPTLKTKPKAQEKLIMYLQRRGYSWNLIQKNIGDLI